MTPRDELVAAALLQSKRIVGALLVVPGRCASTLHTPLDDILVWK